MVNDLLGSIFAVEKHPLFLGSCLIRILSDAVGLTGITLDEVIRMRRVLYFQSAGFAGILSGHKTPL